MKKLLFAMIAVLYYLLLACSQLSPIEKQLRNNINKTVKLDMYKNVRQGNLLIPFKDFREKFKYISVVYLENGCKPCYSKFIEWQKRMEPVISDDTNTILFIIHGSSYSDFMNKVHEIDLIKDQYYIIEDSDYKFLTNNAEIPKWIIDRSLLIDKNNRIKLIGYPFSTPQMMVLYHKICTQ